MKTLLLIAFFLSLTVNAQEVRPVGTFGGFIDKEGKTEIPKSNGFLSFAADNNLSEHQLLWKRFDKGGKDHPIATMIFPGGSQGELIFRDWSTLEVRSPKVKAYLSRTFPAVRYKADVNEFTLNSTSKRMMVVLNGKPTSIDLKTGRLFELRQMSEPWILLWGEVPLYLTLQKRPHHMTVTSEGVRFVFDSKVGVVNLMPLRGVMRIKTLPASIIFETRAWVQKLAAFPIGMTENSSIESERVNIVDTYQYEVIQDDWGTQATPIAPLPPVVVRAGLKGYPVTYEQDPIISDYATFYGHFAYQMGESSTYSIPLANALERLPIALRVTNSPKTAPIRKELERILNESMPNSPSSYYVQNDDIASALMCDAFPTLNNELQYKIRERVNTLITGSFEEVKAPVSVEPVTKQKYRSAGKHQYEYAPFDREWYTGRKLATMARCAEAVDLELARANWDKILGLYRYSQIFYDWVTGSVTSSVFGWNQLADGIHFNWEGVLGVARLAKHLGDEKTYEDAAYRASRQQLALFAIWHQAEWSKKIDYGIAHFSVKRLPNDKIETRGAVDAWVEDFGSATLEFESHWQTANFIYFDNGAQYSLYRDFGIIEKMKIIEFEIMPEMQPNWKDGNVKDAIDNKFYGSGETIAHLLARAVLFHNDPEELYSIFQGYKGTEVSRQWYTPYFYGNAGPLLLGIERAEAPVVEAPIGGIRINKAIYDAAKDEVKVDYTCRRDGEFEFRITTVKGEQKVSVISCEQHKVGHY